MSAKACREYHGKKLLAKYLRESSSGVLDVEDRAALITIDTNIPDLLAREPWLTDGSCTSLVVKPDQLIKRRGAAGLVGINLSFVEVQEWIDRHMGKEMQVERVTGSLDYFIVEPFVSHQQRDEYYLCIQSDRSGEEILFHHEGGVDVGDVDAKALRFHVDIDVDLTMDTLASSGITSNAPRDRQEQLTTFIYHLFMVYRMLNFTYTEINPIVVVGNRVTPLDLAAKIDETASFLNSSQWGHVDFPPPFGRKEFPEEAYIRELDGKTGASLKLTILNQYGRIWTMVAGGGASVV